MTQACAFPNTQSAAYALHEWINENHFVAKRLTARPWNRYEPLNTDWWLVPSTGWPVYRHSKFFFRPRDNGRVLYTGFYVEKGLSPKIAAAYPTGKRLIMGDDWAWHRFFDSLGSGVVAAAITSVNTGSGLPVRLEVDAHFVEDPGSYDPYAPPMDHSRAAFDTADGSLNLVDSVLQGAMFEQVVQCQDVTELAGALKRLPDADWSWVNVNLGVRLSMAPLVPEDSSTAQSGWDAPAIWERCLMAWKQWIS